MQTDQWEDKGRAEGVTIGQDVAPDRISSRATLHAGCRLFGAKTLVCRDAEIGLEAPATINNCYVGPGVRLKGGYFEKAVFLAGAAAGSGAHVRGGTILEEHASIAHTVGLKQTILFPFVTLGSLINFCDCLMAGGTGPDNHSEVGSSYIHFNFTPHQDKATASLIGDVPGGVMLNRNPIFLGGQGGLVGPCRIAYGTVLAAGSINRKDQLQADRLIFTGGGKGGSVAFTMGLYRTVKRQVTNNLLYMANLAALMVWYQHVRRHFIGDGFPAALWEGLMTTLQAAIDERVKRFVAFGDKLATSKTLYRQQKGNGASVALIAQKEELIANSHRVAQVLDRFRKNLDHRNSEVFSSLLRRKIDTVGCDYIEVIKRLQNDEATIGTRWLQSVVEEVNARLLALFPSLG